jgi:GTP cyclohydrolase II
MVPSILHNMGVKSIKLMSNNPRKAQHLRALGVIIDDIIPMVVPNVNHYNRKYLETKVIRMNHTDIGAILQL